MKRSRLIAVFTKTEVEHLVAVLQHNKREGVRIGNEEAWQKQADKLIEKLSKASEMEEGK